MLAKRWEAEMQVHLDFARDFGYVSTELHRELKDRYATLGRRLYSLRARARF